MSIKIEIDTRCEEGLLAEKAPTHTKITVNDVNNRRFCLFDAI